MKLISCVECNHELSKTVSSCVSCGSSRPFAGIILTSLDYKGLSFLEKITFKKAGGKLKMSTRKKVLLWSVIMFFIFVAFRPMTPERQARIDKINLQEQIEEREKKAIEAAEALKNSARYNCMRSLESRLYVPDSVEYVYGALNRIVIDKGDHKWFVQLNYKSKNRFGVMLMGSVKCELTEKNGSFYISSILTN